MLLDSNLQLCSDQAIRSDGNSENVIDLGPMGGNKFRNIGAGEPLLLSILITTTFAGGSGLKLSVSLESSLAINLGSPTKHWTSLTIPLAKLVVGYWIAKGIVIPSGEYKRYLGLRYNVATANFTAGEISAYLHYGRVSETTMRVVGAPGSTNVRI